MLCDPSPLLTGENDINVGLQSSTGRLHCVGALKATVSTSRFTISHSSNQTRPDHTRSGPKHGRPKPNHQPRLLTIQSTSNMQMCVMSSCASLSRVRISRFLSPTLPQHEIFSVSVAFGFDASNISLLMPDLLEVSKVTVQ